VEKIAQIKEYFRQVTLGVKNLHYFQAGSAPKLLKTFSGLEKKLLLSAITALVVSGAFLISQRKNNRIIINLVYFYLVPA